jgi:hypothetical protein
MPRVREFIQDDEEQFEMGDTQNRIELEDSITIEQPNRNYSISRSSSPNPLTQT